MAKEFIDISKLNDKVANDEAELETEEVDENEKLTAEEFVNLIIKPIQELQDDSKTNVKMIKVNNRNYEPDENGIVTLPSEAQTVGLYADVDTSVPIITIDGKVEINLKAVSSQGGSYMYEVVDVDVYTASIGSTAYTRKGSFPINSVSGESTLFTKVNITEFLASGSQVVRLVATGRETGATGYLLYSNITLSTLALSFATKWDDAQIETINLSYYVQGAIPKTLYVTIDGIYTVSKSIGTAVYDQTPYNIEITDPRVLTHGVHKVEAYLAASGDDTKKTESIKNEVFFYSSSSDENIYLVVNGITDAAQPYVETKIFEYCIFANGKKDIPFVVKALSADNSITYLSADQGTVLIGTKYSFVNSFNVDSTSDSIPAYIWFYTTNDAGSEVLLRTSYELIVLDNTNNFAPTSMTATGFILNPKTRNNNQSNPFTIVNENTGKEVESKFTGFDGVTDLWIDNVLRVPAGRKVDFYYYPFSNLTSGNTGASMTMEFDVKMSNLRSYDSENESVLRIGSTLVTDGKILGFEMLPLRAYLLTQSKRSIVTQDIQWQEDVRTHISVNIVNNLGTRGRNYVRIFINGVMNREFQYDNSDIFAANNQHVSIGSASCDIDVYNIRIYKQTLSSQQIQQDYKSAIPVAADKVLFAAKNDILGDDNTIDFDKVQKAGYNTLRFIADDDKKNIIANYSNNGNNVSKGTIEMLVRDSDGNLITKYCQRITHVKQSGQGTSSMTYWLWNLTFAATETSVRYVMNSNLEWIEDTSKTGKDCYLLFPNGFSSRSDVKGVKNVAKANWASSMQSHKMGWCNMYTDLYWACVGNSAINNVSGYENCRKSVTQLPFFFFVENSTSKRFSNLMTFGPAKYDKLCFGTKAPSEHYKVNGKATSMFSAMEGSANGRPLPMRMIPWLTDEVFYYLNRGNDDDKLNECLVYNNEAQLDVKAIMNVYDEGLSTEYEIPKGFTPKEGSTTLWQETEDAEYDKVDPYKCVEGNTIKFFRRAYNFDYLHNYRIVISVGDVNVLRSRKDLDTKNQYWVTISSGENQAYDLFRYNPLTDSWVNAGTEHGDTSDGYARLNLFEQCKPWFDAYNIGYTPTDPNLMNEAFIKARIADYKANSVKYYNEIDCDFDQMFRKLGALKDNWCKNTYESLQPNGLISMDSDDNDTSGDLDNVGASKCPYFAEEHDRCDENGDYDANGSNTYWNSDYNVRFCLREQARMEEMSTMMQTMMNAMAELYTTTGGFMEKYFFSTQEYFPATVYNEQGRLLYEDAAVALAENRYSNAIDPLSQNLGDHLQSEREFWKKRLVYLASWCRSNEFANASGTGTFSFRSGKDNASYRYTVKAHQAIYPAMMVDGVLSNITKHRMFPNEVYQLDEVVVGTQDITCFLCGIDYYTSIGDLTGMAINSDVLNVSGKRLTEFVANGSDNAFRPKSITFVTPRLQELKLQNTKSVTGALDFSTALVLKKMDVRGCDGVSNIILPEAASLTSLDYPKNLTAINIRNTPNVTAFNIEDASGVTTISVDNVSQLIYETILDVVKKEYNIS